MTNWENYLNSIRQKYSRWLKLYTITEVIEKKRNTQNKSFLPFYFDLQVEALSSSENKKQKIKRSYSESKERKEIEYLGVLEALKKYAEQHVLLVGKPGSGKSTALVQLLLEKSSCFTESSVIPVLVELGYYETNIIDLICRFFQRHTIKLPQKDVEKLLDDGKLFLLLDGVNELPTEVARRELKNFNLNYPNISMVFTTRELNLGGNLGIEERLEMQPLREEQIIEFVKKYLPEEGEQLLQQLETRFRKFQRTPLLLTMLCSVFKQLEEIPENLGIVFRQFTKSYERHYYDDFPQQDEFYFWWRRLLSHLAFTMIQGREATALRVAIPKTEAEEILTLYLREEGYHQPHNALPWLEKLLKYHLVQIRAEDKIEFCHQLIQEYYAAEKLLEILPTLSETVLQQKYLNFLKWTEPIALMLALVEVEEEKEAIQIVKSALTVDLQLAARLAGEVRYEIQQTTLDLIINLQIPQRLKIRLLSKTRSELVYTYLLQCLNDEDSTVRWRSAKALGELNQRRFIPNLIQALNDEDDSVRFSATRSLGIIGDEKAIPDLVKALEDSSWLVRSFAIEALGKMPKESIIPILYDLLSHKEHTVSSKAAQFLGELSPKETIKKLEKELLSGNAKNRKRFINILEEMRVSSVIPFFDKIIQHDTDDSVRAEAIFRLSLIVVWINREEFNDIIKTLLITLQDKDNDVRSQTIFAFSCIGDEDFIDPIATLLRNDENEIVRLTSAMMLSKFRNQKAVPPLIKALKDKTVSVRKAAAKSLGQIGSPKAIPSLKKALKDKSIRSEATFALAKVCNSDEKQTLYTLLKNKEFRIQLMSAYTLSQLGNRKGLPILLKAVKNENKDARNMAILGLGNFENQEIISTLQKVILKDDEFKNRNLALQFLENIAFQETILFLKKSLQSDNIDYCRNAINASKKIGNLDLFSELFDLLFNSTLCEHSIEAIVTIQARYKYYNPNLTIESQPTNISNAPNQPNETIINYNTIIYNKIMSDNQNIQTGNVKGNFAGNVGGNFDASGSVLNIDNINSTITTSLNELPDSGDPDKPGIKELLAQLKTAISNEPDLDDEDKAEALEQLQNLIQAGKNPQDGTMKKMAKRATTMLKGLITGLPAAAKLATEFNKVLPAISKVFGL